jgi:crotonobetainyl-CoA hydratase
MEKENVVLTEVRNNVMIITLNRPSCGNAIDLEVVELIDKAMAEAEISPEIRAVIITGTGDKVFSGGMDLKFYSTHTPEEVHKLTTQHGFASLTRRDDFPKPLICAVNGVAVGGATEIALACDFIIAAENAKFGLPEVKRGIFAAGGGILRLMRQLPRSVAYEMVLTGNTISAQQAKDWFIVSRVAPRERLIDEAIKFASEITANAPLSISYSKKLLKYCEDATFDEDWAMNAKLFAEIRGTEDAIEGPRAFAEHRVPTWKGK